MSNKEELAKAAAEAKAAGQAAVAAGKDIATAIHIGVEFLHDYIKGLLDKEESAKLTPPPGFPPVPQDGVPFPAETPAPPEPETPAAGQPDEAGGQSTETPDPNAQTPAPEQNAGGESSGEAKAE